MRIFWESGLMFNQGSSHSHVSQHVIVYLAFAKGVTAHLLFEEVSSHFGAHPI